MSDSLLKKLKRFITARRISLGLMLVAAGCMYLSTLIPQEIDATSQQIASWRGSHGSILWLVDLINLHRIYVQPWFAAIIFAAALALTVSTVDQFSTARYRLFAIVIANGEALPAPISPEGLRQIARKNRYHLLPGTPLETLKFVRSPWGYFGSFLMHLGMVLVIVVSCFIALTGREGSLFLVRGEERPAERGWDAVSHGMLATSLPLPGAVRLEQVQVTFDQDHLPREVSSQITILPASGESTSLTATINRIPTYRGIRIYHATQYGDAFLLAFTDGAGGKHLERIAAQQPLGLTEAGYSEEINLDWSPLQLSAKYYADVAQKSMTGNNPRLVLRLSRGSAEIARAELTRGRVASLGEYQVQLLDVEKWVKLMFIDITGMPLIFAGFAIIMLGGLVHYLTPPRELLCVRELDGNWHCYWKGIYFREFYLEERDRLFAAVAGAGESGKGEA